MIVGCFYHPPSTDKSSSLRYLEETLCKLMSKHKNAKILLVGDFNRIPLDFFCKQFNMKCCVDFCTRGNAILDQIVTDLYQYPTPVPLPSLAGNEEDHCGISMGSTMIKRYEYTKMTKRDITPGGRQQVLLDLAKQDWSVVYDAPDVDTKSQALHTTITDKINRYCPYKTRANKPEYVNSTLDKLMKARHRAKKHGKKLLEILEQAVPIYVKKTKETICQ